MKLPATEIKSIAIFRALQLGDMLCAVPAFRALRAAYPHAKITLVGLPWGKSFTQRFNRYFDDFIHFPGYPGLPEQKFEPVNFTSFLAEMQMRDFDLAIQMQGNGSIVNPMVELFGAKYTAGYSIERHYFPDNGLFLPYPDEGHEIERHLKLMEFLEIRSQGTSLEFPLNTDDEKSIVDLNLVNPALKYICVHPGSRGSWRQWPAHYFAALADYCAEQGYKVVITGTDEEREIVEKVKGNMRHEAIDTTGRTSMGGVAALIRDAGLLIANCTGVSHISSALRTPSVIISMDGEPDRWGPLDSRLHRTIDWLQNPDFHSVFRETVSMIV